MTPNHYLNRYLLDALGRPRRPLPPRHRLHDRQPQLGVQPTAALEAIEASRSVAVDMESATIAANGFRYRMPNATLLCVSDKPLHGQPKLAARPPRSTRPSRRDHLDDRHGRASTGCARAPGRRAGGRHPQHRRAPLRHPDRARRDRSLTRRQVAVPRWRSDRPPSPDRPRGTAMAHPYEEVRATVDAYVARPRAHRGGRRHLGRPGRRSSPTTSSTSIRRGAGSRASTRSATFLVDSMVGLEDWYVPDRVHRHRRRHGGDQVVAAAARHPPRRHAATSSRASRRSSTPATASSPTRRTCST